MSVLALGHYKIGQGVGRDGGTEGIYVFYMPFSVGTSTPEFENHIV